MKTVITTEMLGDLACALLGAGVYIGSSVVVVTIDILQGGDSRLGMLIILLFPLWYIGAKHSMRIHDASRDMKALGLYDWSVQSAGILADLLLVLLTALTLPFPLMWPVSLIWWIGWIRKRKREKAEETSSQQSTVEDGDVRRQ